MKCCGFFLGFLLLRVEIDGDIRGGCDDADHEVEQRATPPAASASVQFFFVGCVAGGVRSALQVPVCVLFLGFFYVISYCVFWECNSGVKCG